VNITAEDLITGQSVTGTANYTITQADINAGSVTNAAFATGTLGNNTITSNTDNATVTSTAIQGTALMLVKVPSPTIYSAVGQNITYTYIVTNNGNVEIAGPISITDNKTGTIQISNSDLASGKYVIGTANYTVTQADIDSGSVTNEAFATGTSNGTIINSAQVNTTVTAIKNPALITVKVASPIIYSIVGQNITYTYTVTNSGNVNIAGPINVTDSITGTIQLSNSDLAPGQTVTGTANYTITQDDIESGSVTNAAFAAGTYNGTAINSAQVTATVAAIQSPALLTVKVASQAIYSSIGQTIKYTYTVTNNGNVKIGGPINITDNRIGTIQLSNIDLAPGHSVTGTANYTVTQADINAGSVTNEAFATGTYKGTEVKSNTATTVAAVRLLYLTLVKLAYPTNYSTVGQIITYNYIVINSGNVVISGPINVTDNITGTIQISNSDLEPAKYVAGATNYTITQADLDNKSVINAAYSTGTYNGTKIDSGKVIATVTAINGSI